MATTASLWKSIESARKKATTGQYFLPQTELQRIFTRDVIADSVNELSIPREERIGLATKIYNQGITVFAILIWMRREHTIVHFRQHGCLDSELPIDMERAEYIAPDFGLTLAKETQWEFLPYEFEKDMCGYHIIIRSEQILPFVEEQHHKRGGFGDIFKMKILSSQQSFVSASDDLMVIRKRIEPNSNFGSKEPNARTRFEEEMICLRLLHRLQHPNIVKLLAAYSYRGEQNLLFPCLEMDLNDLFKLEERPKNFKKDHTFFGALYGLASALENVHTLDLNAEEHGVEMSYIGYHHDVRPHNVLVHGNTFFLADFGLSKMKGRGAGSQTDWKVGIGDYIAPECMDKNFVHQRVGRAIDIWAFGCLMADVLTYMDSGKKGLDAFSGARLSAEFLPNWEDEYFFGSNGIKPAVSRWLETFGSQSSISLATDAVEVVSSALKIDPLQRPTASEIAQKLAILSIKANFSAVNDAFADYVAVVERVGAVKVSFMRLWFEKERLNALETFLLKGLSNSTQNLPRLSLFGVKDLHRKSRDIFSALLGTFENEIQNLSARSNTGKISTADLEPCFDVRIQSLIQQLWLLIPATYRRRIESDWRKKLLNVDNEQPRINWKSSETAISSHNDESQTLAGSDEDLSSTTLPLRNKE